MMNYAIVKFNRGNNNFGGQGYYFKNIEGIEEGDLVVVDTQHGYQVVQVVGFTNKEPGVNVYKHVIQKVDFKKYEERVAKQIKIEELEEAIEQRIEKVKRIEQLRQYKDKDRELTRLIDELENIGGLN